MLEFEKWPAAIAESCQDKFTFKKLSPVLQLKPADLKNPEIRARVAMVMEFLDWIPTKPHRGQALQWSKKQRSTYTKLTTDPARFSSLQVGILKFIRDNGFVGTQDIHEALGASRNHIRFILKILINRGDVGSTGAFKSARYFPTDRQQTR